VLCASHHPICGKLVLLPACSPPASAFSSALASYATFDVSHMHLQAFPNLPPTRFINFDSDMKSCVPLFAVLLNHWPYLASRKSNINLMPVEDVDFQSNAQLLVKCMQVGWLVLRLSKFITARDVLKAHIPSLVSHYISSVYVLACRCLMVYIY
jgi:hypothetical protein